MENLSAAIETLQLPPIIKRDLAQFAGQLLQFYKSDLVSLIVIGSAAGSSYREKESDLNLLVIYSDLNIADLNEVAGIARKWLKKRRFAPRFLSRRNLLSSADVFPLDMLDMKERHVIIYGENILTGCELNRKALAWQLSTELKSMRMRIKQQFWRTEGDPRRMAIVIAERFSSLMFLGRGLLVLENADPGASPQNIRQKLVEVYQLDPLLLNELAAVKRVGGKLSKEAGLACFTKLMDVIRVLDDRAGELRP